jgi:hypothetical protein
MSAGYMDVVWSCRVHHEQSSPAAHQITIYEGSFLHVCTGNFRYKLIVKGP